MHKQFRTQNQLAKTATPLRNGLLQRACACGQYNDGGGCSACEKKRLQLSTRNLAFETRSADVVPPIVHEVLRSSGQPLDAEARAFFEPRFGHDFSHVRVHTDAKAAESARAVHSLAYTVGNDVVFGTPLYASTSFQGRQLLAHELTHVVQQSGSTPAAGSAIKVGGRNDVFEREADAFAGGILHGPSQPLPVNRTQPVIQRNGDPIELQIGPVGPAEERRLKRERGITLPAGLPQTNPADTCPKGYKLIPRSTWFKCDESLGTRKLGCGVCTPRGQQCKCTELLNLLGHHRIIAPKTGKCGDDFKLTMPVKGTPIIDVVKAEIPGGDTPLDIYIDLIPALGADVTTGRYDVCLKGPETNDDQVGVCGGSKCPALKSTPKKAT